MDNNQTYILRHYAGWGNWQDVKVRIARVMDEKRGTVLVQAVSGEPFARTGFFGPFASSQATVFLDQIRSDQDDLSTKNNLTIKRSIP